METICKDTIPYYPVAMATEIFKHSSVSLSLLTQRFLKKMFRFLSPVIFYRMNIFVCFPEGGKRQNVRFL